MVAWSLIKRVFDFLTALFGLLILSPLFLAIAGLIWSKMGLPIVFRQQRSGYQSRSFCLYKFRSMSLTRDIAGNELPDELRLTNLGRWLRKTSLDELPQLWNVFRGEMSIVGPRPLLPEYLPLYSPEQARRHDAKPGITGWAQVNGRNSISWEERLKLDVWYVDHQSFCLDMKIIWLTILIVLRREGVSQRGQATMEKFQGSK